MKRARISLGAVTLLGFLGGGFAFKANTNSFGGSYYCGITRTTSFASNTLYTTTIIYFTALYCSLTYNPLISTDQQAYHVTLDE